MTAYRGGGKPAEREHGTPRGYGQHYRAGEKPCEACTEARDAYRLELADARRAEQGARRERWAAGPQPAPEPRTREEAIWGCHREFPDGLLLGDGGLVQPVPVVRPRARWAS